MAAAAAHALSLRESVTVVGYLDDFIDIDAEFFGGGSLTPLRASFPVLGGVGMAAIPLTPTPNTHDHTYPGRSSATGTICPPVQFKVTGIAPGQAPGRTAIVAQCG